MTDAQRDQLDSVLLICAEVERHANAIDPSDPTAASVLVELNLDLVTGVRILTKIVRENLQAPIAKGSAAKNELPVALMDTDDLVVPA